MNKEFYEKIIKTAQAAIDEGDEFIADGPVDLTRKEEFRVSGKTTVTLNFNSSGDAGKSISKSCIGAKVKIEAWIDGCPDGSVFDIKLDTNYSEHFSWTGVKPGDHIKQSIKTNTFSKTNITVAVHSNKPDTTATAHIHYST